MVTIYFATLLTPRLYNTMHFATLLIGSEKKLVGFNWIRIKLAGFNWIREKLSGVNGIREKLAGLNWPEATLGGFDSLQENAGWL